MSVAPPRFETGDTRQFVITYSAAPATTPIFSVRQGSGAGTLIASTSATSSSSTAWYAFHTIVDCSPMAYVAQWIASFTAGPVVNRDTFVAIKTTPG